MLAVCKSRRDKRKHRLRRRGVVIWNGGFARSRQCRGTAEQQRWQSARTTSTRIALALPVNRCVREFWLIRQGAERLTGERGARFRGGLHSDTDRDSNLALLSATRH